ncbi:SDR family oxidoreductase, partial [Ralstonia pseudosolanacearum]|uniref:SDR family oxidoreductase n=1 Tax=Ralstonia pseudosolanacearum TaxID=1310165 RepID=UPI003CF8E6D9
EENGMVTALNRGRPGMAAIDVFETERLAKTLEAGARAAGVSAEAHYARRREANPARRFGQPAEFGAVCAFLCSRQAGYLNAQNILLDGGAYPGTF